VKKKRWVRVVERAYSSRIIWYGRQLLDHLEVMTEADVTVRRTHIADRPWKFLVSGVGPYRYLSPTIPNIPYHHQCISLFYVPTYMYMWVLVFCHVMIGSFVEAI